MLRRLGALGVLLVVVAFALVGCGSQSQGASPAKVAGEYVKGLARNAGVTIIGDKVWAVRKQKDGTLLVVVRVRYKFYPLAFLGDTTDSQVGVTTIFVHLVKSSYQVAG